jgi:hypothetical protein
MKSILEKLASKRFQMELSRRSYRRLEDIAERIETKDFADVMSNALRLYEALVKQADAGSTFIVRHPDGSEEEQEIFRHGPH